MHNLIDRLSLLSEFDLRHIMEDLHERPLKFDHKKNIFRTRDSIETILALYGKFDLLRDWHGIRFGCGKLRRRFFVEEKSHQPETEPYYLPQDAVVFSKSNGRTLIILSKIMNMAIKIENHIYAEAYQNIHKRSHDAFVNTGLKDHIPAIISIGKIDGVHYTVNEFVPREAKLFDSHGGTNWPRHLANTLLPVLRIFHEKNGHELKTASDWGEAIKAKAGDRLDKHPYDKAFQRDINHLDKHDFLIPIGMASGDLQPQNIHFFHESFKILDWSNIKNCGLILDVFCTEFYPAMANPSSRKGVRFWSFLNGHSTIRDMHAEFKMLADVWKIWIRDWLEIEIDDEMLRWQLRGMCWDWLVTMEHPWRPEGGTWSHIKFPDSFLNTCEWKTTPPASCIRQGNPSYH